MMQLSQVCVVFISVMPSNRSWLHNFFLTFGSMKTKNWFFMQSTTVTDHSTKPSITYNLRATVGSLKQNSIHDVAQKSRILNFVRLWTWPIFFPLGNNLVALIHEFRLFDVRIVEWKQNWNLAWESWLIFWSSCWFELQIYSRARETVFEDISGVVRCWSFYFHAVCWLKVSPTAIKRISVGTTGKFSLESCHRMKLDGK